MHRFVKKNYLLYTFCLTIAIGLLSFSYETTYQFQHSVVISRVMSARVHPPFNVTSYQEKCPSRRIQKVNNQFLRNLFRHDGVFNYLGFVLRSHSLFYCSVPKVATRTLLLFLTYLHIRDDVIPLLSNHSESDLLNIPALNETIFPLIKNDSRATKLDSISLLRIFLSQLLNASKIDLWSIYQKKMFPFVRLRTLSNPSSLFAPNYRRVIFVRHPFERLASAYIDKITSLRNEPFSFYDRIRRAICRKYSSLYLTEEQQNLYRTHQGLEAQIDEPCQKIIPAFEHFIQYFVFDEIRDDVHWRPYSSLCHVCLFQYNFIGKFETIEEDLPRLIKSLGLNASDWIKEDHFRSGKTKLNYQLMFSSLNDRILCYLKHFYKTDLKLFHYRLEDYLSSNRTVRCSTTFFTRQL